MVELSMMHVSLGALYTSLSQIESKRMMFSFFFKHFGINTYAKLSEISRFTA